MIFQFVICAAILRKLVKQNLKRHWVNCYRFLALGEERATESTCPKRRSRAPFFLALITSKRSACYARLGWLDAPVVFPTHGLSFLYMTSWCLLIIFFFCMTIFPHERDPSPLSRDRKEFFSRSKIKCVLLEDADRRKKFKRILSFLFVEKGKSF